MYFMFSKIKQVFITSLITISRHFNQFEIYSKINLFSSKKVSSNKIILCNSHNVMSFLL